VKCFFILETLSLANLILFLSPDLIALRTASLALTSLARSLVALDIAALAAIFFTCVLTETAFTIALSTLL